MSAKSNRKKKIVLPKEPKVPSPICTNLKCRKRIKASPKVARIFLPGPLTSPKFYGLCDHCASILDPKNLEFR